MAYYDKRAIYVRHLGQCESTTMDRPFYSEQSGPSTIVMRRRWLLRKAVGHCVQKYYIILSKRSLFVFFFLFTVKTIPHGRALSRLTFAAVRWEMYTYSSIRDPSTGMIDDRCTAPTGCTPHRTDPRLHNVVKQRERKTESKRTGPDERSIVYTHTPTHPLAPLHAFECMPRETAKHHSRGILNDPRTDDDGQFIK